MCVSCAFVLLLIALQVITPISANAATCTWNGGTSTAWSTSGNWSTCGGSTPGASDDVVINVNTNPPVLDLSGGGITINSLSIGASSTASLTISNGDTATKILTITADLTIGASGTLYHTANAASATHRLTIAIGGNATITGSINLNGKGYQAGLGSSCGTNGSGTGPGLGESCGGRGGGGGGYGGTGGNGQNFTSSGGAAYGSVTNPVDLGSGGGGSSSTAGGAGGGLVRLTVTGTTTVNGSITANGSSAASPGSNNGGGGGAGGTVYISTGVLAGNGSITANGGDGGNSSTGSDGGGGAGGRVAIYYTTSTWSGTNTAYGGNGNSGAYGGAGTVYVKDNNAVTDTLTLNNNGHVAGTFTVSATASYTTLSMATDTVLSVTTNSTLTVGNTGTVTWYNLNVASGSTLVANSVTTATFSGTGNSIAGTLNLNGITSLTIGNGVTVTNTGTITSTSLDTLTVGGGTSGTLTTTGTWNTAALTSLTVKNGATYSIGGTYSYNSSLVADVQSGGTWTHSVNTTAKTHFIDISLATLTVAGTVDVSSKGYQPGNSTSCGTNGSGTGAGTGYGCGSYGAGGAAHGGSGGASGSIAGGSVYGSITAPSTMGSGGGGGNATGGYGGGFVKFTVSGTTTITGTVKADGGNGATNGSNAAAGGGAGGGIYINTSTLAGNGSITANGGNGGDSSLTTNDGGGGGGGRIAVYYATSTWSGTTTAYGGNGYSATSGGAGTIYFKDNTAVTDTLTLNNNGRVAGTFVVGATASYTTLSLATDTAMTVNGNSTLTIGNTGSITPYNLSVTSGSTLVANSVTGVTFSGTSNSIAGTLNLNGISSLTIGNGVTVTNTGTMTSTSLTTLTVGGGTSGTLTTTGTWNTAALTSLTVKNGATYTIGGTYSYNSSLVADVQSGGTWTHSVNTTAKTHFIDITLATLTVAGTVDVSSKGYQPGNSSSCGTAGSGSGGGSGYSCGSYGGGGGAHGGSGGASGNIAGGSVYGSVTAPSTLGSGGGGGNATGGYGGGFVKFTVSGTTTITGTVKADGGNGATNGTNAAAGGGAGGGIYIDTGTLAGNGSITANGGNGGDSSLTTNDGGGGGGGRIAIYYTTSTWSGTTTAYGGNGYSATSGGAGTIYVKDNTAVTDTLTLNNNGRVAGTFVVGATASYTTLSLATDTAMTVNGNSTLTIGNTGSITPYNLSVTSGSTLVANSVTGVTFSGTSNSIAGTLNLNSIASLTIGNGVTVTNTGTVTSTSLATLTVGGGTSGTLTTTGTWNTAALTSLTVKNGATYTIGGTYSYNSSLVADVQSGGTWTHSVNTTAKTHFIDITLATLTVSGTIDVSSKGYQPGNSTSCGTNGSGSGAGSGYSCGSYGGGGAAHGGSGGASGNISGGAVYGSIATPSTMGSGGGGGNATGGYGGGFVKFTVSGTTTITGTVKADGGNGGTNGSNAAAGGGAGGGIYIDTNTLAGNGSITANGGDGGNSSGTNDGGGGGGGRIAVYYSTSTWSGTTTAYGGNGYSASYGGAGTIYVKNNTANTDTLTLNNNGHAAGTFTVGTSVTYNAFSIASDTALTVNNNATLTINHSGSLTLNALTIANGSSFVANSLTSVLLTNPGSNAGTLTMNSVTTFQVYTGASFSNTGTVNLNGLTTLTLDGSLTTTGTWNSNAVTTLNINSGGTLNLGGTYTFPTTMNGTIASGGNLTHGTNTTTKTNYINLGFNNLTVSGTINVNGKGYQAGTTASGGGNGSGSGGGLGEANSGNAGSGGGYGGAGGTGQTNRAGGTTYGSSSNPVDLGSGGGASSANAGGAGGGYAKLTVTGTLTIGGSITANGSAGSANASNAGGGGSGGTIWISAGTLAGAGSIAANGGLGGDSSAAKDGGSGGGGRVYLYYIALDGVSPFNTANVTANGGAAAGSGGAGSNGTTSVTGDNAPNTPSSLGPAGVIGGGWTTNNQPSFTFTLADADVADTVKYTILIDDNNDFSSPVVNYVSALAAQGSAGFTVGQAAGSGSYTTGSASQTLGDGSYYWAVRSTDSPGASSAWAYANGGSIAFKVDTTAPSAPSISSPSNNSYTNSTTPTISGSSEASATITVRDGMSTLGTTTANGSGAWSYVTGTLSVGAHSFTAKAADAATNESGWSSAVAVTIDTTAPSAPTIDSPASGTTTNDNTPTFSGTSEASATIDLYSGGSPVASTTADGSGNWSYTFGTVGDGTYSVTAKATDLAGNQGVASSAVILNIDTGAPAAPSITSPSNNSYTNDDTPALSGTAEAGSTVSVYEGVSLLGTTTANGGGAWSYTTSQRSEGAHTFTAKATDAGNNTSVASTGVTVTVDTTNPTAPGDPSPSASPTNDPTPGWSWSAGSDTVGLANPAYTVQWSTDNTFGGGISSSTTNSTSFTHSSDLADGTWYFRVKATDLAGNSSSWTANGTVVIDGTPPSAPSITSPSNGASTSDTTPTISGTAEANASIEVFESGVSIGTTSANGSGAWSFTTNALAEGSYAFKANATDGSNNASGYSSTVNLTVDTTAPSAPAITSPTSGAETNDQTPALSGTSEANATISVYEGVTLLGTTTANGSGAWSYTVPSTLSEGAYSFKAKATDAAANVSGFSSSVTLTVDITAPSAPSISSPITGSVTNDNTPTISGSAEANSTVTVYDGLATLGTTTANGSGAWSYTPSALTEAAHDISAKATDAAGNQSSASTTVVVSVDITPPAVPVISSPSGGASLNDDTPAVSGTAEASATVEIFDGVSSLGTVAADGMGAWSFTSPQLSEGAHAIKAKAIDLATNESALSSAVNITIDTTAPSAPSISSPTNNTNTSDTTPTLSGTAENDATVTVYDGVTTLGTTTANGSGAWTYTPSALSEGAHSFTAKATDAANNQGVASSAVSVTIDTTNPSAPGAPSAGTSPTSNQQPSWTWSASTDAGSGLDNPAYTVQWSQASDFGSGVSSATTNSASYTHSVNLAEGTWYVRGKATDKAANVSSWSSAGTVVIDVTAPSTPAITAPDNNSYTNDTTPTLSGTAEANATVQVYDASTLLGTSGANGSGAWTFTPSSALSEAAHAMKVKVVDAASNESTFSSIVTINVDTTAPSAPTISSPTTGATVNTQTPTVSGSAEANSTVAIFDGVTSLGTTTANGSGAWSYTTSTLSEGAHSLKAKATDAANNTSSFSTAVAITVDVTVPAAPAISSPTEGAVTGDDTPTITGSGEANATITVYDGSTSIGTTTANGSGAWTYTSSQLSEGAHALKAKATDAGNNDSAYSTVVNITVDITAPITPAVTSPTTGSYTNDKTPDLAGTAEANATVTVYDASTVLGTSVADGSGAWTFTPSSDLTEAVHSFKVKARDAANNDSAFSTVVSVTVDATAPAAPVIAAPTNNAVTNNATPVISGTAEANATVKVYDASTLLGTSVANGSGSWTFTPSSDLSEAAHTLTATATDASLNTSVASTAVAITVDITNPTAPVIAAPTNGLVTNQTTPAISGTAENNAVVSIYDGASLLGTSTANSSGAWSFTPSALSEGAHTLKAKSTDSGSNSSAFSTDVAITVDVTAPATPVITSPTTGTSTATQKPAISGTAEANSTVSVFDASTMLGTSTANGSGAWSYTPSDNLSDAAHTIKAKATDAATNVSAFSAAVTLTVDATAPTAPTITSPSNGSTNSERTIPVLGRAEANATVKLYNGSALMGTTTANGGGNWNVSLRDLSIATYTLKATATDSNNNVSGYSNTVSLTIQDANPEAPPVVTGDNAIHGQVLQNGQPVEGARVTLDVPGRENPTALETTTDESGNYSFENIRSGDFEVVAEKQGAVISRTQTQIPQSETPTEVNVHQDVEVVSIRNPVYTFWNSFLGMINILEITNESAETLHATVTVYSIAGQDNETAGILATRQLDIPAHLEMDFNLAEFANFIPDSYGLVKVNFDQDDNFEGRMTYYRPSPTYYGEYEYAFSLPFTNSVTGNSYVTSNTYQPSTVAEDQVYPVENWLSIGNLTNGTKQYMVRYFDQAGTQYASNLVTVSGLARVDVDGGNYFGGPNKVSLLEIVPLDQDSYYLASLGRYGRARDEVPGVPAYRFGSAVFAENGNGSAQYMPISNLPKGANFIEVANVLNETVTVNLTWYDTYGHVTIENSETIPPHGQVHLLARGALEENSSGSVKIEANKINALIAASMTYHYDGFGGGSVLGIEYSPARESFATELYGSYNLYLGMANWLRVTNTSDDSMTFTLTTNPGFEQAHTATVTLAAHARFDVGLHDANNHLASVGTYGPLSLSTGEPGKMLSELLRVKYKDNNVDFSANAPVR